MPTLEGVCTRARDTLLPRTQPSRDTYKAEKCKNKRETPVFQSSLPFSVPTVLKPSAWTRSPWLRDWRKSDFQGPPLGVPWCLMKRWAGLVACWCFSTSRLFDVHICPSLSKSQELHFQICILLSTGSNFWGDKRGKHMESRILTDTHSMNSDALFYQERVIGKSTVCKKIGEEMRKRDVKDVLCSFSWAHKMIGGR